MAIRWITADDLRYEQWRRVEGACSYEDFQGLVEQERALTGRPRHESEKIVADAIQGIGHPVARR